MELQDLKVAFVLLLSLIPAFPPLSHGITYYVTLRVGSMTIVCYYVIVIIWILLLLFGYNYYLDYYL